MELGGIGCSGTERDGKGRKGTERKGRKEARRRREEEEEKGFLDLSLEFHEIPQIELILSK